MYRFDFDTGGLRSRFGCWVYDPSSGKLSWNQKMREVFGLPETSPSPTFEEFLEFVHPDDRQLIVEARDEDLSEFTFRIRHPDGGTHMLHSLSFQGGGHGDGKSSIVGVVYDVTEEKRFLGDIQRASERYRGLVEDMPALACRFLPDGTLVYVNTAYANAYGVQPNAVIGENWLEFLPEEDRKFIEGKIAMLSPRDPTETYEHWISTPSGERRALSWTYRGFFDDDENLAEIQLIGLDLTEQRKTERQVFHMSKLRSLGELAAATAHELYQPLSAIMLIAENVVAAMERQRDDEWITRKMETIISQSERLKFVVERMKSLSRPVSDVKKTFLVRQKIRENVDFLRYVFEINGIEVLLDDSDADGDFRVFGNPDLFEQVLINLLMNAREAVVAAAGMCSGLVPSIRLKVEADSATHEAVIRVSDNGGGADETILPKIFEPFFTTKNSKGGTGLGLAICFSIITQMKGSIRAANWDGGLMVEIRIPLAEKGSERPALVGEAKQN